MPFLYTILALILVAILAWLVNNYRPTAGGAMSDPLRNDPVREPLNPTSSIPDAAAMREDLDLRAGNLRTLANLVLLLIVIGIFIWLINTYIPMAESIKAILNIVVVVATCVLVLKVAGLWDEIVKMWNDLIHHRVAH